MSLRDPLAIARGLGPAKAGLHHWWMQRISSVALMFLVPWFVWFVLPLLGADRGTVRDAIADPLQATLLLAFVFSLFWHTQQGLQVVVEDYIHAAWLELTLQLAIKFACALAALAAALAVGRIVFSA
jgi:succinate dehydrogenase / fumarate reductase membrane anchor subunit